MPWLKHWGYSFFTFVDNFFNWNCKFCISICNQYNKIIHLTWQFPWYQRKKLSNNKNYVWWNSKIKRIKILITKKINTLYEKRLSLFENHKFTKFHHFLRIVLNYCRFRKMMAFIYFLFFSKAKKKGTYRQRGVFWSRATLYLPHKGRDRCGEASAAYN